MVYLIHLEH